MSETEYWLRIIPAAFLGFISVMVILGNVLMPLFRKEGTSYSMVPLIGGISGALALVLVPWEGTAIWFWVPMVLDLGCFPLLLSFIYLLIFNREKLLGSPSPQARQKEEVEKMDRDSFWRLVEQARATVDDPYDLAPELVVSLQVYDSKEIISFAQHVSDLLAESYRWDLWAVAYIVNGGCSDDGFEYFRGWLIAQGRERFEAALENPVLIGDWAEADEPEYEEMLGIGWDAYMEKTGEELPMDAVKVSYPESPLGEPWEEDELENLYPKLWAKFS